MKKIFTLMLTFACAMFVGVSCTNDPNGGGAGGGDSKDPFKVVWDTENAQPTNVSVTVTSKNKNDLFLCLGSSELVNQINGQPYPGETPLQQIDYMLVECGMLQEVDPTNPADGYLVFKGTSDVEEYGMLFKKTLYRQSAEDQVQLYVVGIKFSVSEETGETTYEYTTDLYTYEAEFPGYPELVVAEESVSVTHEEGTYELSCELKNPMADMSVSFRGLPSWVEAVWADNVVTLTYNANPSMMERSATFEIEYGYYAWVNFTLTQAANPNVTVPTLDVTLAENGNYFNKFVVNVTSSDPDASYVVGAVNSEGNTLTAADLTNAIINNVESETLTYYKGNQSNVTLKLNCNIMEWSGLDHYVYVCPVDSENNVVLAEPTYIQVTVDDSNKPVLAWVETDNFKYDEAAGDWVIYVAPNAEDVVLSYTLTNPAEEGEVKVASFTNGNGVIAGGTNSADALTLAQPQDGTGTVTFDVADWNATKSYHHSWITLAYRHATDSNWQWNVGQIDVKVVHIDPTVSAEPLAN